MATTASPLTRVQIATPGQIASIDTLENEDSAIFTDEESEMDSDYDIEDVVDATAQRPGIPAHLAFLAGAIPAYPLKGVVPMEESVDVEDGDYIPDAENDSQIAQFVQEENVDVDVVAIQKSLEKAAAEAAANAKVPYTFPENEEEAQFSDGDEDEISIGMESDGMDEDEHDSTSSKAHLAYLNAEDVDMEDDEDENDASFTL